MKNNRKGFTTVELVIVIAVIAILAAVLIPTFTGLIEKANVSTIKQEARNAYSQYVTNVLPAEPEDDVYVLIDGKYYLAEGGVVSDENAKGEVTTRPNDSTVIDTDGKLVHDWDATTGKCKVCETSCTATHTEDVACGTCGYTK